jgi:hypothetical protein
MFAPQENKHEEINEIESSLRALKPAATSLDRDRLMYLAGQASLRPARPGIFARSRWALATAASVVLAGFLGRATAPEQVQFVERVVQIPVQVQPQPPERDSTDQESPRVRDREPANSLALPFRQLESLPIDGGILRPYTRLRDQVVALGPDMLPALGSSGQATGAHGDSYIEMRQRLVQ